MVDLDGDLGQSEVFTATGGSTTTFVDTKIGERIGQKPGSNSFIDSFAVVTRDAGLLNAAPEGQFQRISLYDSSSYTFTLDAALTAAIAAGDEVTVLSAEFYGRDLISRINRAIQKLVIALPDVTLTYDTSTNLYSLPAAAKMERPRQLWIQGIVGDNDSYVEWFNYDYVPSAGGSVGGLRIDGTPGAQGATVRLVYDTFQPALTAYGSVIHETIKPALAIAAAKVAVLEWYCNKTEDSERWAQMLNIARADLTEMLKDPAYMIYKPRKSKRLFHGPSC